MTFVYTACLKPSSYYHLPCSLENDWHCYFLGPIKMTPLQMSRGPGELQECVEGKTSAPRNVEVEKSILARIWLCGKTHKNVSGELITGLVGGAKTNNKPGTI